MDAIQLKHNQMNNEIIKRNIPSQPIQPYLSVPSTSTRFVVQPKYDFNKPSCNLDKDNVTEFIQQSTYDTSTYFYPGTRKAPFSGFSTNINIESQLRNQHIKNSKDKMNVYVPHSKSSLYHFNIDTKKTQQGLSRDLNPHFLLFQDYNQLCSSDSDNSNYNLNDTPNKCIFHNNSRLSK